MLINHDWDDENYDLTLNDAFDEYLKFCYPQGLDEQSIQYKEVRQAFFSGIHWLNCRDSYDPLCLLISLRKLLNIGEK